MSQVLGLERDERFMARAIELARQAEGRTHPNPVVGCVIVRQGHIIAQGHHAYAGGPHAEVMALRQLGDATGAGCTMYVTLEPCCTHGRTPPCTSAVIARGVERVVVGSRDPNPDVHGKGLALLRDAGIEVRAGVLEAECDALNRAYFKRMRLGLPWVVAKYAMTLDGKLATRSGHSAWITGEAARRRVHELRDRLDGILVGAGTLRLDDPRLTCRAPGGRDPWRLILEARLEIDDDAQLLALESEAPTVIFASDDEAVATEARAEALRARGVQIERVPCDARGRLDLEVVLRRAAALGLMSVLVEGGATVHGALMDARLVDEVYAFVAPKLAGGLGAPSPIGGEGVELMDRAVALEGVQIERFGDEILWHGLTPEAWRAWS